MLKPMLLINLYIYVGCLLSFSDAVIGISVGLGLGILLIVLGVVLTCVKRRLGGGTLKNSNQAVYTGGLDVVVSSNAPTYCPDNDGGACNFD